jgi:hypothetical protein
MVLKHGVCQTRRQELRRARKHRLGTRMERENDALREEVKQLRAAVELYRDIADRLKQRLS